MSGPFRRELFAPCGMDCAVCYQHLRAKKPCPGCLAGDEGKPNHCRACAIRDCRDEKGVDYCFSCPEFPCKRVKALDKTYRTRYGVSLVDNGARVREAGMAAFLAAEAEAWTCPTCGGAISLHDGSCPACAGR